MFRERKTVVPTSKYIRERGAEKAPVLFIHPLALDKMDIIVTECKDEVGWLGFVKKYDDCYLLEDVMLLKQKVHGATCELDEADLAEYYSNLYINNPDNAEEIIDSLRLWGHSHVNMGVSPSGQDDVQALEFANGNEWFFRLIANKNGEMEIDFYDFERDIMFKNIKWQEFRAYRLELEESLKAEIKEKVTKMSYGGGYKYPSYGNNNQYDGHWDYNEKRWIYPEDEKKTTKTETYGKKKEEEKKVNDTITTITGDGNEDDEEEKLVYWVETNDPSKPIKLMFCKTPTPEFIKNVFTVDSQKEIARCVNYVTAQIKMESHDPMNRYSDEDAMLVLEYCRNIYPN